MADSGNLHLIVGDTRFSLQFVNVHGKFEETVARSANQNGEPFSHRLLCLEESRKIDPLLFPNEQAVLTHILQSGANRLFVSLKQFHGLAHQRLLLAKTMTVLGEDLKRVEQSAATAARVTLFIAELLGNAVGGFEADSPNLVGKTIGITLHHLHAVLPIFPINLCGIGNAHAMSLQEEHDVLDVLLLRPALLDLFHAFLTDSFHLIEALDVVFNHVDGFSAELGDNETRETRSDAFDQTAAEIFFYAVGGGRHHLLPTFTLKLLPETRSLPIALTLQNGPHTDAEEVTDHGDEGLIVRRTDAQDGIARLCTLEGDVFHHATHRFGHREFC